MIRAVAWLVALVFVAAACRPGPVPDRVPAAAPAPAPTVAPTAAPTVAVVAFPSVVAPEIAAPDASPTSSPTALPVASATPNRPPPAVSPSAPTPVVAVSPSPTRPPVAPVLPPPAVIPSVATVPATPPATPVDPAPAAGMPSWQYRSGIEVSGARSAVLVLGLDRGGRVVNFGTGISIAPDGLILTTVPAVRGAAQLVVRHPDGPAGAARLLTEDAALGLVVLRSEVGSIPIARLGSSATARPGDPIAAVGFVSVAGGSRQVEGQLAEGSFWRTGPAGPLAEIPFAAPVTPGYSGAPLLNAGGEVIGIVTQAPAGGTLGVAVPIDRASDLIGPVRAAPDPAVAVPRADPAAPAGAAAGEILAVVAQYYAHLNAGDYQSSYAVMSESARRAQSLAAYLAQFRSLESIQATQPVVASLTGDRAIVQLQTTTATRAGGRLYRQHWEITWYLVREGGVWRREALDQRAISEATPIPG